MISNIIYIFLIPPVYRKEQNAKVREELGLVGRKDERDKGVKNSQSVENIISGSMASFFVDR